MKRLLAGAGVVLALLCGHADAWSQSGGSPSNPLYQRRAQGNVVYQGSIECNNNTAVLTLSSYQNILSIYFQNMETTANQRVGVCPRASAVGGCDSEGDYAALLNSGEGWTTDVGVNGVAAWSCDGVGGTYTLNYFIEAWYDNDPRHPTPAAPTPIPTPTPTPTP